LIVLWARYQSTEAQLKEIEAAKSELVKQLEPCQRLMDLEGVGPVCASMLYASLGDGREFKNGRHASVYIGLTPKQHSSGGKVYMTGIDKNGGNKELRAALYQGALSVISRLPDDPITAKQKWLLALVKRAGIKRSCIALANKTVRTAWALLTTKTHYQPALHG
jgi:transposase